MNKYKRESLRRRIIAIFLTAMMFVGCIAPLEMGVYADDQQTVENTAPVAPAAPAISVAAGYESATVSWRPVANATGYVIRWKANTGGYLGSKSVGTATSYKVPFDPYPGDANGRGTSGVAKTLTVEVQAINGSTPSAWAVKSGVNVIHPMYIVVQTKRATSLYATPGSTKSVGKVGKNQKLVVVGGSRVNAKKKRVVIKVGGKLRYIKEEHVKKIKFWYNSKSKYSNTDIENFANTRNVPKGKGYFIWVNTSNQMLYLFKYTGGRWKIDSRYSNGIPCNTGKTQLTPYGLYSIGTKWKKKKSTGTKWWCIFRSVGIHQVLGRAKTRYPLSTGCVRIPTNTAKWFYQHIPKGTKVLVY